MKLVDQYKNLVFKTAWKVNKHHNLSQDDLQAAGMRGLVEAEQTWDAAKGSLCTWVWFKVRKAVQAEAAKQRTALSENVTASQGDNAPCNLVDTLGTPSEAEDQVNREELHNILLSQIRRLPKKQQRLMLKMLAQGMTQAEYAAEEGCSQQLAQYLYKDALRRLRGLLERRGVNTLVDVL